MQLEKPLTETEELQLRIVRIGSLPNERDLQEKMRKAAEGKVMQNGIARRPNDTYRP
jgi:hypothetical protein